MNEAGLTLRECAERLGVHYMTVYRYVRLGMLPAHKEGAEWKVDPADLAAFRQAPRTGRGDAPWAERLHARMVAGDENGAWGVIEAALASGLEPKQIYLDVLGPALRKVGEDWADGTGSIPEEHRASAVASRLVGRLGRAFRTKGRSRGRVLLGTPPGERHSIPVEMVADLMRGVGLEVIDLGVDLPIESFVEAAVAESPLDAIAISVTTPDLAEEAAALIAAVHAATDTPIVIGGGGIRDEAHARSLGADAWARDAQAAIDFVTESIGA